MTRKHAGRLTVAMVAVLALAASGCSVKTAGSTGAGSDSKSGASNARLPADIRSKGAIDVGVFVPYAPITYMENGKVVGTDPTLIRAVGDKLGIEVRFHTLAFESMIPSIVNGRNDVLIGSFQDTAERRKQVDFLDISRSGMRAVVLKGNPKNVDPDNACGLTGGEEAGSYQLTVAKYLAEQCEKQGRPRLKVLTFTDPGQAFLSLENGRTDLTLQAPAVAKYTVQQNEKLEVLEPLVSVPGDSYEGWILPKGDEALRTAFVHAIQELIEEGRWQELMKETGIGDAALIPPLVNTEPADIG
ncbi:ABC transporter substrate-binding protein [Streptomyces viridiviolaceus]|uniref:Transporter substrate-binding domain-containing protein n=1 Tax=Streptomyces viridiviolaceus TaxID=68282 RepID=A0ABW2E600_9ACTN|nr:transporter substrate-binding domain-containing protein [Streptomyces viridiviolaceus]GHB56791.1 ABC transporter substrate-binding protein [Streptomyces viridiviolaceus]